MRELARSIVLWTGVVAALAGYLYAAGPEAQPSSTFPSAALGPPRAVLDRYCVTCHNERLRTAGLMLDKMDVEQLGGGAETWEKVVRKLRTGAMPPAGKPRPDKTTSDALASWLESGLDRAAAAAPNPGRVAVHRLNRSEYTNAVRDLLTIAVDEIDVNAGSLLPADDSGYGFDNIADVLTVSPMLLERYLSAARRVSRLALGDPTLRPIFLTYDVPKLKAQDDHMSDDLPFGSRGGIAVSHYFPHDGEYVITIRLQRSFYEYIRGLGEPHQLDVYLDGIRISQFTVGGVRKGRSPLSTAGVLDRDRGDPAQEEYEMTADAGLVVRIPVKAGPRRVGVAFMKRTGEPEGVLQARLSGFGLAVEKGGIPAVSSVTIGGPFESSGPGETPSRERILVCRPTSSAEEAPCARKILSTLARRAYRRPVTEADVQPLLELYEAGRQVGGFETGIEWALERILVAPSFLFRIERDPTNVAAGKVYRISDLELASRLSFFLWSSIPDDELLEEAVRGRLKDPAVLARQVRRMIGDSRSSALVTNFAGQWLQLRNLRLATPDPDAYPDFDENLREAFQRETELLITSQLREDRSVLDLLSANYTFVNERLARHYGIPNVYGNHFRRVKLTDDRRGGLLGHGSVLTVTSYATRTSPVLRGKWLLENILGAPPPPPPANVPDLKDRGADGQRLSVRERMEQHRANPVCASCHARMDPLGFALDNFDAIGQWRSNNEANTAIDASGVLPDGTKFQGPAELRGLLLRSEGEFAATVTEKLLTYALGRGVEYYDAPAVRKIVREAAPDHYHWSSIVLGLVKSMPFQMRRSAS